MNPVKWSRAPMITNHIRQDVNYLLVTTRHAERFTLFWKRLELSVRRGRIVRGRTPSSPVRFHPGAARFAPVTSPRTCTAATVQTLGTPLGVNSISRRWLLASRNDLFVFPRRRPQQKRSQSSSVSTPTRPQSFYEFLITFPKPRGDSDKIAIWDLRNELLCDLFPPNTDRELYNYLLRSPLPDYVLELAWRVYRSRR